MNGGFMTTLAEKVLNKEIRGMARIITLLENNASEVTEDMKNLYTHTGRAFIVGITGAPGAGKSTLVDKFTSELRSRGFTVGIIAVDPTSPFSGGAILGDRIRMQQHSTDDGVFIRSMATRGMLGGLSACTTAVVNVMDAYGKDVILIETVGVGQDEVEIVKTAQATIVVTVPGLGDEIQAIKAGILEIGDLFVVNKADKDGADETARELEIMLSMGTAEKQDWKPPIVKTVATKNEGITELVDKVYEYKSFLEESNHIVSKRKLQTEAHMKDVLREETIQRVFDLMGGEQGFDKLVHQVADRELDPYTAVEQMLEKVLKSQ
jgi:LAO/AO transport system kinase